MPVNNGNPHDFQSVWFQLLLFTVLWKFWILFMKTKTSHLFFVQTTCSLRHCLTLMHAHNPACFQKKSKHVFSVDSGKLLQPVQAKWGNSEWNTPTPYEHS